MPSHTHKHSRVPHKSKSTEKAPYFPFIAPLFPLSGPPSTGMEEVLINVTHVMKDRGEKKATSSSFHYYYHFFSLISTTPVFIYASVQYIKRF